MKGRCKFENFTDFSVVLRGMCKILLEMFTAEKTSVLLALFSNRFIETVPRNDVVEVLIMIIVVTCKLSRKIFTRNIENIVTYRVHL